MQRYGYIFGGVLQLDFRFFDEQPPDIPHKGVFWLPAPVVAPPAFNVLAETIDTHTFTVGQTEITEAWTVRPLTPEEVDAAKTDAVYYATNGGSYHVLLSVVTLLENDIRDLRSRILNAALSSPYSAGQKASVTEEQVKSYIKDNLV